MPKQKNNDSCELQLVMIERISDATSVHYSGKIDCNNPAAMENLETVIHNLKVQPFGRAFQEIFTTGNRVMVYNINEEKEK